MVRRTLKEIRPATPVKVDERDANLKFESGMYRLTSTVPRPSIAKRPDLTIIREDLDQHYDNCSTSDLFCTFCTNLFSFPTRFFNMVKVDNRVIL